MKNSNRIQGKDFFQIFLWASLVFLSSCTSFLPQQIAKSLERPEECQAFFDRLDEKVAEAGVVNAEISLYPVFPTSGPNRFSIRRWEKSPRWCGKEPLVQWMQALIFKAERLRLTPSRKNLSVLWDPRKKKIQVVKKSISQVEFCSSEAPRPWSSPKDFYPTLLPLTNIPDEYSTALRVVGLYPLRSFR